MLLEVIRKDLVLNRTALLLNNVIFAAMVLYLAHEDVGGQKYAVISSLMFSFAVITVLAREDKFKARGLGCSLPVTGRRITLGRYVLGLGTACIGAAYALSLPLILPTSPIAAEQILNLHTILTSISTFAITIALLVPFTIRFGLMGVMILLVSLQVLGVATLAFARYFEAEAGPKQIISGIATATRDAYSTLGTAGFTLALLAGLAVVSALSCRVSMTLFDRRRTG